MEEKIKIICLAIAAGGVLLIGISFFLFAGSFNRWERNYNAAYQKCLETHNFWGDSKSFLCIGILNGRSMQ